MPIEIVRLRMLGALLMRNGVVSDALAQPFGYRIGELDIGVRHHHHEFLAAIAAGQIDAAHIGGDTAGEFP